MRASSVEQIILETLSKQSVHLTSQQVFQTIRQRLPAVNQSTVYRALERLAEAGKISVSDMGTGATVYESLSAGPHHHLVCQRCGHVQTIDHATVGAFFETVQAQSHFQIATRHLVLFGRCEGCATD
ncbi:MAG TPA: transcriptional repressor [Anaerolineaceae bacterium]